MQGKIIKGIAGFYYVNVVESGLCGNGTKAALQSAGSISGYDGAERDSGHFVF